MALKFIAEGAFLAVNTEILAASWFGDAPENWLYQFRVVPLAIKDTKGRVMATVSNLVWTSVLSAGAIQRRIDIFIKNTGPQPCAWKLYGLGWNPGGADQLMGNGPIAPGEIHSWEQDRPPDGTVFSYTVATKPYNASPHSVEVIRQQHILYPFANMDGNSPWKPSVCDPAVPSANLGCNTPALRDDYFQYNNALSLRGNRITVQNVGPGSTYYMLFRHWLLPSNQCLGGNNCIVEQTLMASTVPGEPNNKAEVLFPLSFGKAHVWEAPIDPSPSAVFQFHAVPFWCQFSPNGKEADLATITDPNRQQWPMCPYVDLHGFPGPLPAKPPWPHRPPFSLETFPHYFTEYDNHGAFLRAGVRVYVWNSTTTLGDEAAYAAACRTSVQYRLFMSSWPHVKPAAPAQQNNCQDKYGHWIGDCALTGTAGMPPWWF